MVLGKLPVPRRLINLDDNRAKAYCAYSVCVSGGGGAGARFLSFVISHFLSCLSGRRPDID